MADFSRTKKLVALTSFLAIAIGLYFLSNRFFYFKTNAGTNNVFCFNGTPSDWPKKPDEWVEVFLLKDDCEASRAKAFNPTFEPRHEDQH